MKSSGINFRLLLISAVIVTLLFILGFLRLEIDFDVVASLPRKDPVIRDAAYIFKNHPMHDQILVDVGTAGNSPDILVQAGSLVEMRLKESGIFSDVGLKETGELIPGLISHLVDNLPSLFTAKELDEKIAPMLEPDAVEKRLAEIYLTLTDMEGIGQSRFIAVDPLGMKDIVLARMIALAPVQDAVMYRGKLLSSDRKHLLVTARPKTSSTDTSFARSITGLIAAIEDELDSKYRGPEKITLTPMGAYRAALDNELIVRKDVKKAIIFATAGIALLLLLAFPRPWIGLLSLLPAVAGTMMAFFTYSLFHKSISIMVLGFGGAVISITVDHGIAYLLFLDRPDATRGKEASREIRAVGFISVLTTMGAFLSLCISGFPVLSQLGQFTALGILFSFIFIHSVFPRIFPYISAAPQRDLPLQRLVNKLASFGNKGALAALVFACCMIVFAKPVFDANLSSMNTVSGETTRAEKLFTDVWGDVFSRIHIMAEEKNLDDLQSKGDLLVEMIDGDIDSAVLSGGFVPAMLFPGEKRRRENFTAWKEFWSREKIAGFKAELVGLGELTGFTKDAFDPFFESISSGAFAKGGAPIAPKYFNLMGISENKKNSTWIQFSSLTF
ncbi:MAG: MMPL family transporter, partial [Deltaproteobacteria bacterium]|nr:MMPL family transporter [Deltaproteobacteria bacterium]